VFELGKDLFDGIEIGAVGRQEDKMGAFGPDGLACRLAGAVNLPTGGRAKTGALFPWRFPLALSPWRYAAMPGSAISRHATIAPERSARSSDDDMAWRGQLWRFATPSWMETNRWRCRADVNRFMIHLALSH
jgi:hypothetical protein